MKKQIISLSTALAVGWLFAPSSPAADETVLKGEGCCAKCALKETSACQNAVKVSKDDGSSEIVYFAANAVSKDFHSNLCQGSKPIVAVGKLQESGGKKEFVATKLLVAEKKTVEGEGLCLKCALKKADKCQNAVRVTEGGKEILYILDQNKVSKDFHGNVCQSTAKVKATGTCAKIGDRYEFTAAKLEKLD